MEAIQDVDGLFGLFGDDVQGELPHISADITQALRAFLPKPAKEAQQCFHLSRLAHPEQALAAFINLVDQRQVVVSSTPLDLVNANRLNPGEFQVLAALAHRYLTERKTCSSSF
jgi:hypothetical protein